MRIVSLFSGAGGLDLGFIQAGHNIVWANDIYDDAVATYKQNIGNHITNTDIKEISSDDIPDCDMVIGGFPCQGFSVANVKRHSDDTRNSLYKELLRVITDKKPKYFLAENVKGLLSLNKGTIFSMILKDFCEAGYNVVYKVLNSANYGVPQKRERVIIVGVRKDLPFLFEFPDETHSENGCGGKADSGHLRISEDGDVFLSEKARWSYGASIPPKIILPDYVNRENLRWRWDNYNGA